MTRLITTEGELEAAQLGLILPHEHIFVDLRSPSVADFGQATAAEVVACMAPQLERARQAGVTALVECTPEGVGRRSDLVLAAARAAAFPVALATGIYREPWVPEWAQRASQAELAAWMRRELQEGIGETGVRAAFIKVSAGDDGLTPLEAKILRAAAQAGAACGAAIASHTIRGQVVQAQLDLLEAAGFPLPRFVWVHAQAEADFSYHLAHARRGIWLEYDNIGSGPAEGHLTRIQRACQAGLSEQLLLSMDRGWFSPGQPGGGEPKPFTYLPEVFLPVLQAAGFGPAEITALTSANPFRAFAR